MRTLTAAEKAALLRPNRRIEARVYIARNDGATWVELTRCPDGRGGFADRVLPSSIDEDLDRRTRQLSLVLSQDANLPSLSPLDESSLVNQFGGIFDPLLTPVRECKVKVAITVGAPPTEGDFKLLFHGYLGTDARPNAIAGTIEVTVNDLAKRLQVAVITEAKTYAEGAPTDIETIIQNVIDDNLGAGVVALYVPVSPAVQRQDVTIKEGPSVWDTLQELVDTFGWDLRYRYDEATDSFRLTLQEPPRDILMSAATPVITTGDDNLLTDEQANVTDDSLRNKVTVRYYDQTTGNQRDVVRENLVSQQAYWLRPMIITGNETFPVKDEADAIDLAEAALADLQDPRSTTELSLDVLPWLEIHDIIGVRNRRVRDRTRNYAVAGFSHSIAGGDWTTTITAYTQVRGAVLRWLRMEHRPGAPGKPPDIPETRIVPAAPANLHKVGEGLESVTQTTLAFIDLAWSAVQNVQCDAYMLQYRQVGTSHWETLHLPLATDATPQRIGGLPGNRNYELRVAGVNRAGVQGNWSNVLSVTTLKDTQAPTLSAGITVVPAIRGLTVTLRPQTDDQHANYATDWSRVLDWDGAEVHVGNSADFVPDASTLKDSGKKRVFGLEGLQYDVPHFVKVCVYDTSKNYSSYETHEGVSVQRAGTSDLAEYHDSTVPAAPTGLTPMPAFRKHVLVWNAYTPPPLLDHYEMQYSTRISGGTTWSAWVAASNEIRSGIYTHEGLDLTLEYRYRMRAVSKAGVAGVWTAAVEAGVPGKVSLSEDVVGRLARGDLADDVIAELDGIATLETEVDDNTLYIGAIGHTAEEISQTVAEVYPDGTSNQSTIQQLAGEIALRIMSSELKDEVIAAINLAPEGARIQGIRIVLDGDTDVVGDFRVRGDLVVDGSFPTQKLGFTSLGRKPEDGVGLKFWGTDDTGGYFFQADGGAFPSSSCEDGADSSDDGVDTVTKLLYIPTGTTKIRFTVDFGGSDDAHPMEGVSGGGTITIDGTQVWSGSWDRPYLSDYSDSYQPTFEVNTPASWYDTTKQIVLHTTASGPSTSGAGTASTDLTLTKIEGEFQLRMLGVGQGF